MSSQPRPRVAVLGEGQDAERWACALRSVADVGAAPEKLPGGLDAVLVTKDDGDAFARTKEALLAGLDVLCAAPFLLSPWQVASLNDVAGREGRLLRFSEPFQGLPGFAFLRRLLAGQEPLWRPLYLRATSLARNDGPARLDELATEQLAACQALCDTRPDSVSATVARGEEGEAKAVFLIVHYTNGLVLQSTVSLAESENTQRLVAVTPRRSAVLEMGERDTSVLTISGGDHEGTGVPDEHSLAQQGHRAASAAPDLMAQEAASFMRAVSLTDLSHGNGERWAQVTALWWAARESMISGEREAVDVGLGVLRQTEPPPLRVIRGGGRTVRAAHRPPLTVVAN